MDIDFHCLYILLLKALGENPVLNWYIMQTLYTAHTLLNNHFYSVFTDLAVSRVSRSAAVTFVLVWSSKVAVAQTLLLYLPDYMYFLLSLLTISLLYKPPIFSDIYLFINVIHG